MNPPLKRRIRKPKSDDRAEQEKRLRAEFEVYNMKELAALFGVDERTLKNRDPADLPPYTKCGGTRLFFKPDVVDFMRKRMNV